MTNKQGSAPGQGQLGQEQQHEVLIYNAKIVTEQGVWDNAMLHVKDGNIALLDEHNDIDAVKLSSGAQQIDAKGSWLLPGFIDVHVHGGYGADFMDSNKEILDTITGFHVKYGTTGMLATSMTAPKADLDRVLAEVNSYMQTDMPYAQLLGVHLEGPFISHKWPGAQNPNFIAPPQVEWLEEWHQLYPQLMKQLTLAPEREGALEVIAWLRDHGIVAACGHTDSSYADIQAAANEGLTHAVHTFNAMKALHHREPGTVGAVLTDERISAEVIADGLHVHPAAIRLLTQVKQQQNLLLITDAMSAAGLGDGDYELGGLPVVVKNGEARLKEGNSLAGSTLTMIDALRFVVREVGVSVEAASRYASGNPAKLLRMDDRLGSIAKGKQADLILVSPELEIERVWIRGSEIVG
ncbi:N-acetylglucosamine-6-phosphate deacetylase [compost metagenome]